ncbi:MAG: tyrosine-type recombinase/integrase [Erythrobacter sp.]|nr:tyrosine-type recombinase/integrase [Erythrobacter sp.]NCQ62844.1 tyrosine-type recombinase/integrase [Alphaproteobacteria bacterium]
MTDLSKITERDKLKTRKGDEPHWQRLRFGCYLGYRPSKRGGKGTWFARAYDADTGKYPRKALGDYGALAGHDVFRQAKSDAENWADTVESGGVLPVKLDTVADACEAYLEHKPGSIAEGVFRRHVYSDPIAKVKLDKLRRHHLREWRKRLEESPALLSRNKGGEMRTKERSKSTINRDMVPLRAALAQVLVPGSPNTDAAWQEALKPYKGAHKRRDLYLDHAERKRLVEATDAEAAPFVRALCLLPLRPGAVANLLVADFDKRTRTLTIGKDKHGRPRQITVPETAAEFLGSQAKDKLPAAPLFSRRDGRAWNKDAWKHPIKDAVSAAKLASGVSAYTLRHSVITDLIRDSLPALTVAQLSGTSVVMIERHYGHLVRDDAEQALARLTL